MTGGDRGGEASNYTYILRCADGSLYTGWTNHLEERVAAHNAGRGGKYTRSHRPVELLYYETYSTEREARSREYRIKQMTRREKLALIGGAGGDARTERKTRE